MFVQKLYTPIRIDRRLLLRCNYHKCMIVKFHLSNNPLHDTIIIVSYIEFEMRTILQQWLNLWEENKEMRHELTAEQIEFYQSNGYPRN